MNTTTAHFKLRQKIKDTKFSIDDLHQYNLLLQAGEREFQLCIIDSRYNHCLLLEHYDLIGINSRQDYLNTIEELFRDHHLLMAGFWNCVKLSIKNKKFCLVPASLFDKENLRGYLSLNCKIKEEEEKLFYYRHIKTNAVNIFATDAELINWINARYPNLHLQVLHHTSAIAEGIMNYEDLSSQRDLFIQIENGVMTAVITNEKKLELCNIFNCDTEEEFLKYTMMLFRHFHLDQNHTKVVLWGNIDTKSPYFNKIAPFIKNLSFGIRPKYLKFNYMFDEAPDHRYFDLFSIYLCD